MARTLPLTLALFLALAGVCSADDGGMAAPGGGDVAAPAEPPAGVVETPVAAEPAPAPESTPPPVDIGPYGPNHESTTAEAAPVASVESGTVDTAAPEAATHTWPPATASAAEPPAPPELVGASEPGATAAVGEGGGLPAWLLVLGLAAFLAAVIAATAGMVSYRPRTERNVLRPIGAESSTRLA